jgi:VWFA-related protein
VLLDLRVVDQGGAPVLGLRPEHFAVEIDGQPAQVETVEWVSGAWRGSAADAPPGGSSPVVEPGVAAASTGDSAPVPAGSAPSDREPARAPLTAAEAETETSADARVPGRLVVILFQKDFFTATRVGGYMKMTQRAAELVARLAPEDRVAVLSFDSRLRVWLDFAADRARVQHALRHALIFERPRALEASAFPSLLAQLDRRAAHAAARLDTALRVLGEALTRLPGPKSLALFGWGLGRVYGGRLVPENDYPAALQALTRARTAVFALDVTDADQHTLEYGLKGLAEETGGFYAKTHSFADIALNKLERALAGYYVLSLEAPASLGYHSVRVRLRQRKGTVLVRPGFET